LGRVGVVACPPSRDTGRSRVRKKMVLEVVSGLYIGVVILLFAFTAQFLRSRAGWGVAAYNRAFRRVVTLQKASFYMSPPSWAAPPTWRANRPASHSGTLLT